VAIEHGTTYRFDRPVSLGPHVIRLRPAPHCRTPITSYSMTASPSPQLRELQQDAFGNHLARVVFPEKVSELTITVDLGRRPHRDQPFDFFVEDYAERFPFEYPPGLAADLEPYRRRSPSPAATPRARCCGSGYATSRSAESHEPCHSSPISPGRSRTR